MKSECKRCKMVDLRLVSWLKEADIHKGEDAADYIKIICRDIELHRKMVK